MKNIKFVAFDADDTLWVNEPHYQDTEQKYQDLLSEFGDKELLRNELFKTEMSNLHDYGFGAKSFMLSMIETALKISQNKVQQDAIAEIIRLGKKLINTPIEVLPKVEETLNRLSKNYLLIVATKGDLLDQERKLEASGLAKYFHHIEIMSDKKTENYKKMLEHLEIAANQFVMIGNSLKSDILPVIELGGKAIYVPFHTTWEHEKTTEDETSSKSFMTVDSINEIIGLLNER